MKGANTEKRILLDEKEIPYFAVILMTGTLLLYMLL